MKFFVVACLFVAAAAHDHAVKAKWSAFKAQHRKEYHASLEAKRMQTYIESSEFIERHNAKFHRGEVGYELGHNEHSDIPAEEFRAKMLGRRSMSLQGFNITEAPSMRMPSLPASFDWRDRGIVTPAKNQDQCGSCYSFGTVGVIESAIAQKTGRQLDLSEQQVVDCSYMISGQMNGGCQGGHEAVVMEFVKKTGLVEESRYPYASGSSRRHYSCSTRSGTHGLNLRYQGIPPGDERRVAEALVAYGTIVIPISGENRDFQLYKSNIYDNPRCPKQVDHVVSIVGFGTEGGRDFWIIKNSWGASWGQNGFGKILRGVNQCGMNSDYSYTISV